MKNVGRPRNPIAYEGKVFKITPKQDRQIDIIVANQYPHPDGVTPDDRSHFVRLAIENYINEFYKDQL